MKALQNILKTHRSLIVILATYFLLHVINLTRLPIFNDESSYLDWAWSYTHMPGHLYDSLLDAKQPLLIWIFAIFENFFPDPLFAGRLASVLIGSVTVSGIYLITKRLFNIRVAFIASLLYTVTPIFVFYNRVALMEAPVACIGIWSFYATLNILHNPKTKAGVLLGIVLGIGFFIKTSSLLFIISSSLIVLFYACRRKSRELVKSYLIALAVFCCVDFVLLINPVFWQTLPSNSRYSYTPSEFFTLPPASWLQNISGFFEIGLVFITPLVFLLSVIGSMKIAKEKMGDRQVFLMFFICPLLLEVFSARIQGQRYLIAFLPFLIIPASYLLHIFWEGAFWKKALVIAVFFLSLVFTLLLLTNPDVYISQLAKVSPYSESAYISGQTSGYGVKEALQYIKNNSVPSQPTMVLLGLNAGNPESAIDLYSQRDPKFYSLHIDKQFFPGIDQYTCMTSQYPAFFVTRNDQLKGMDRYFMLAQSFPNPDTNYHVKIYTLKKPCSGRTISLSDLYQGAMLRIQQLRSSGTIYQ